MICGQHVESLCLCWPSIPRFCDLVVPYSFIRVIIDDLSFSAHDSSLELYGCFLRQSVCHSIAKNTNADFGPANVNSPITIAEIPYCIYFLCYPSLLKISFIFRRSIVTWLSVYTATSLSSKLVLFKVDTASNALSIPISSVWLFEQWSSSLELSVCVCVCVCVYVRVCVCVCVCNNSIF